MLGLNKVFVMGNLTRDPELRYTPNGQPVASFGIATNRRWTTPEGEKRDEVEFHNIVAWGRSAEVLNQYVKKGRPLFVEGRLKTQNWEGTDGVKRTRTEIVVENFNFIDSGSGQAGGNPGGYNTSNTNQYGAPGATNVPGADQMSSAPGAMNSPADMAGGNMSQNDMPVPGFADTSSISVPPDGGISTPPTPPKDEEISIDDIPF